MRPASDAANAATVAPQWRSLVRARRQGEVGAGAPAGLAGEAIAAASIAGKTIPGGAGAAIDASERRATWVQRASAPKWRTAT